MPPRQPAPVCPPPAAPGPSLPERGWDAFDPQSLGMAEKLGKRARRLLARRQRGLTIRPVEGATPVSAAASPNRYHCEVGRAVFSLEPTGPASAYGWVRLQMAIKGNLTDLVSLTLEARGDQVPAHMQTTLLPIDSHSDGKMNAVVFVPPETERLELSLLLRRPLTFSVRSLSLRMVSRFEREEDRLQSFARQSFGSLKNVFRLAGRQRQKGLRGTTRSVVSAARQARPLLARGQFRALWKKAKDVEESRPCLLQYPGWLARYGGFDVAEARVIGEQLASQPGAPQFSVVMPTYNTDPGLLEAAIESVETQAYPNWQLVIADDASTSAATRRVLREAVEREPRIRVVWRSTNGHISAATNSAIEAAAGDVIGFLDHDDILQPHALLLMADAMQRHPGAKLFYSDEDKLDVFGQRSQPYFKPDFNPDLLRSQNYICHFTCIRKELVDDLGGLRTGFEGSQDYDLMLRATERLGASEIVHIPQVLYSWRQCEGSAASNSQAKPYAYVAAERALTEHLERQGMAATIRPDRNLGLYNTRHKVPEPHPHVTIIVPTRDNPQDLRACVDSLRSLTTYRHFDILLVDNNSQTRAGKEALKWCASLPKVSVLRYPKPFNFSAINNFAVAHAKGEVVCLVNDDIEATHADWLEEMLGHAMRPDVGAVGARLLYPNGRVQHAGVALGIAGIAAHPFRGLPGRESGLFGRARLCMNYSAVTAACLMVRKDLFQQVGGFDEDLMVAYNDIDFCLRLGKKGLWNVYTPHATLTHKESATRGNDGLSRRRDFLREHERMISRWAHLLCEDPCYNQNLSRVTEDLGLAFPPRTTARQAIEKVASKKTSEPIECEAVSATKKGRRKPVEAERSLSHV